MNAVLRALPVLAVLFLFSASAHADTARVLESYGNIPLAFTVNEGQLDSRVKFTTVGSGCSMFFTPDGATFLLSRETAESAAKRAARKSVAFKPASGAESTPEIEREAFALKVAFVNANENPELAGEDRLSWNSNYFVGSDPMKWRTDVPNYSKIRLKEIYTGVDLVYYGNKNRIKYDFVVKPGEDPSRIVLTYDLGENAGNAISINASGELVVKTPLGEVIERKPYCYQTIGGKEIAIPISYRIIDAAANTFGFEVGEYDEGFDLCVDPEIVYSTYLGVESASGIAVDGLGNAYVTGTAYSSDFPVTSGAFDTSESLKWDVFVTKFNENGTALVYSTFLGGEDYDNGIRIVVDDAGDAYVEGSTKSPDFPVTSGAFDKSNSGGESGDIFVAKLNASGSALVYSTFLGGKNSDFGIGIAVDKAQNLYMIGSTRSPDFPVTSGAYDTNPDVTAWGSCNNIFVTKLNASGSSLGYSTFLGNAGFKEPGGIAVDGTGCAYVTGTATSGFPVTSGAFDTSYEADFDVFVTKFNASGSGLVYSTFLGGSSGGTGIAVDDQGNAYVTGWTDSPDFPVTSGAFDASFDGVDDIFVTKLNANGTGLVYSTFLGGALSEGAKGIAADGSGNAYVVGYTYSSDFPVTNGAFDSSLSSNYIDTFVTKINPGGTALVYSTFLGGGRADFCNGIAVDGSGSAYVCGNGTSGFPVTDGAYDTSFSGGYYGSNAFITKLDMAPNGLMAVTAPNGCEYWIPGMTKNVAWIPDGTPEGPVKIELFREHGAIFDRIIVSSTPNTGSYAWTIPTDIPDRMDYRIRVTSLGDTTIWDHNDGDFRITYDQSDVNEAPAVFAVSPPYPNPFNPSTTIRLKIPKAAHVKAAVYDILGQEVRVLRDGSMSAGTHALVWDGRDDSGVMAASGVYFYTVRAGMYSARGKVMFLR